MVTTSRCSVISLTLCVLGTSTSMPDCRMGAVIMKMIRSTRTTSMNGIMLISESDVCVDLDSWGMELEVRNPRFEIRKQKLSRSSSTESFLDLGGYFQGKRVEALG